MKNIKLNIKKLAFILGMTASSMVLITGCGKKERKTLYDYVYINQDNTCFDEIIDNKTLKEVTTLKEYIELSNELKKYKFERYELSTKNIELMPISDIKILLAAWKEEEDYKRKHFISLLGAGSVLDKEEQEYLIDSLNIQEQLVNEYIYNGYATMDNVILKELKALKLDAMGLDEKSYETIEIPASNESGYRENTDAPINIGNDCVISKGTKYADLLGSLYDIEKQPDATKSKRQEYNKDRNKLIESSIEKAIKVMECQYSMDKKKNILERKRKINR